MLSALFFLDLDGFKRINDSLGHSQGDRVLKVIAERLKKTLRSSDVAARLGGDEFGIIVESLAGDSAIGRVADQLSRAVEQPISIAGEDVRVGVSMGIVSFPGDGEGHGQVAGQESGSATRIESTARRPD